jgi:hypothetical protein
MKMNVVCSFETSVSVYQTTRRYFPEDNIPHSDRSEITKSKVYLVKPYAFTLHIFGEAGLIEVPIRFV